MTKEQLLRMNGRGELHYTGDNNCGKWIGPKGGVKEYITKVRLMGKCQTWKRDPIRFRQPVKYGFGPHGSFAVEPSNQDKFHLPEDCNPTIVKR